MSIKLRPEAIEKLEPEIARFIEQSNVERGNILDTVASFNVLWDAENLLPKEGPVRDALDQYIGEYSLNTFIADELRSLLAEKKFDDQTNRESVVKVLGLDDPRQLARELLTKLQGLPRSYYATLPLPPTLTEFVRRLPAVRSFGPNIRFVHDADEIKRWMPKGVFGGGTTLGTSLADLLGGWSHKAEAVLQVHVDGFVPRFGDSETVEEAKGLLKSFFGLAIGVGLLKAADFPQPQAGRLSIYFSTKDAGDGSPLSQTQLSYAATTAISGLSYAPQSTRDLEDLSDAEARMGAMDVVLSAPDQNQLLLRACRWLFESHVSEDPLLSFVQATVVLEILLGDHASSDEIGLTTLLANRCAYMVGTTTSERTAILKTFKALYKTRSKIVHTGKHRLSSEERVELYQLRSLARRVIQAEMRLAREDVKRQEWIRALKERREPRRDKSGQDG